MIASNQNTRVTCRNATFERLQVKDGAGRALWKLVGGYSFPFCVVQGIERTIPVPSGYVTNFGTIPKGLTWLVHPADLAEASLVHDYLTGEYMGIGPVPDVKCSRWIADAVLYEGCHRMGLPRWKSFVVLSGVRTYAHWNRWHRWLFRKRS